MSSNYGWAKAEILYETTLDEAWNYIQIIKRRKASEYKLLLHIYHTDKPEELAKVFEEEQKEKFKDYLTPDDKLDKDGFAALKSRMTQAGTRITIKG